MVLRYLAWYHPDPGLNHGTLQITYQLPLFFAARVLRPVSQTLKWLFAPDFSHGDEMQLTVFI
jgi:hypothetical protein